MPSTLFEKLEVGDCSLPSQEIASEKFQLAIYDPTDPSDIEFVGDPFGGSPRELAEARAAIRDYYTVIDGLDVPYSVGVFPVRDG